MTNVPPVNEYPTTDTLKLQNALDYIPKSLHIVLKALFVGNETEQKINFANRGNHRFTTV